MAIPGHIVILFTSDLSDSAMYVASRHLLSAHSVFVE